MHRCDGDTTKRCSVSMRYWIKIPFVFLGWRWNGIQWAWNVWCFYEIDEFKYNSEQYTCKTTCTFLVKKNKFYTLQSFCKNIVSIGIIYIRILIYKIYNINIKYIIYKIVSCNFTVIGKDKGPSSLQFI